MPTYDYICQTCGFEFEEMQKITASPLLECPKCKKESLQRKVGGGIGLNFAGSGFYCTDYKKAPKQTCCPCGKNSNGCTT